MGCEDARCDFRPIQLQRRPLGDNDVLIETTFCGVCHSDLHFAANHLKGILPTKYPCVPGHELVGVCVGVGAAVTKFALGEHVGVGCMVDSCLECSACTSGEEQKCVRQVPTYQGEDRSGRAATFPKGGRTLGGYSDKMVVNERFAIKIPPSYPPEFAGPVMCAGVTMFEPLKRWKAGKGTRVGVVGLGGLGVMGIKLATALGCEVTALSRSDGKRSLASASGASAFVLSTHAETMAAAAGTLDLVLNTVPCRHDTSPYTRLLAAGGKQVLLGISPTFAAALVLSQLSGGRTQVIASAIGSIGRTQEVIDFCSEHKITPDIELFPAHELNGVLQKLDEANETGLRYVMDIVGTLNKGTAALCTAPPPKLGPFMNLLSIVAIVQELFKLIRRELGRLCSWMIRSIFFFSS